MTVGGWIFLVVSAAFVWGLTGFCFYKVFTLPPESEPAEPVRAYSGGR